ncbi:aldo/keto reductase [Chondromyces crocatus]|uniref:Aldo/keto reductase n=1 Tax=Chondromyces crocatus TaxID=52 RepID=A0A0K1EL23_CHOCO|nr:aldo/keto reductase [Chondromyces crocatus]AKT41536.1 aldo/keto reductase [Chondromyces crocatus]
MRYRMLGQRTGLKVSELALGGGMFGTAHGYGAEPDEARRILEGYLDAGGNFIDTADNYQLGQSETLIGEIVGPRRNDVVLASKFSSSAVREPSLGVLGNSRKVMVQSVEDSLKRLKTDRIDLYFVHMDDGVTPLDEIVRGFDDLVSAGKIVYAGLSNFAAWRTATAVRTADLRGWTPIAAIQVEYSLLQRTTEREILPMAEAFGLGVMGWSPLAGGLLTGKSRRGETGRATGFKDTAFKDILFHESAPQQVPVLDALLAIGEELGVSPGQVAIAWVRAKGVLPVLGPRTRAQLDDNLAAATLTLTSEQVRRLDEVSAVPLGYPHELLAAPQSRAIMTGGRWDQIDFPGRAIA